MTFWRHFRARLGGDDAYDNRLFDPEGRRPPLWFQPGPEGKAPEGEAGKNRLHVHV